MTDEHQKKLAEAVQALVEASPLRRFRHARAATRSSITRLQAVSAASKAAWIAAHANAPKPQQEAE